MVLVAYRHGLRAAELVTLRWDAVDFAHGRCMSTASRVAPNRYIRLSGRELRALRRLKRDQDPASPFIFTSERGAPFTTAGFRKMIARLGVAARFGFPVHPHMLRHACGYKLANDGVDTRSLQAYLGHKQHPAHGALHRAGADPLQELLARLIDLARLVPVPSIIDLGMFHMSIVPSIEAIHRLVVTGRPRAPAFGARDEPQGPVAGPRWPFGHGAPFS